LDYILNMSASDGPNIFNAPKTSPDKLVSFLAEFTDRKLTDRCASIYEGVTERLSQLVDEWEDSFDEDQYQGFRRAPEWCKRLNRLMD
jgi:hypothetical protein